MKQQILQFWNDERGVTTLEYAIIAALLVAGLAVVVTSLTTGLGTFFEGIVTKLNAIGGTTGGGTGGSTGG